MIEKLAMVWVMLCLGVPSVLLVAAVLMGEPRAVAAAGMAAVVGIPLSFLAKPFMTDR